jgi:putative glutamine amidotransferase
MQLLNVLCGGTLHQDLSERPKTQEHQQPHDRRKPHHVVELRPGTVLSHVWDTLQIQTNSTHHQLIDEVGRDLITAGVAPDGVVEAIEHRGKRFCVGVQWHPEVLGRQHFGPLFKALVEAAFGRQQGEAAG